MRHSRKTRQGGWTAAGGCQRVRHSNTLRFLLGGAGQFGPIHLVFVGPASATAESAVGLGLNLPCELDQAHLWDAALNPCMHRRRFDAEQVRYGCNAAQSGNDFLVCHVHVGIIRHSLAIVNRKS